MAAYKAILRYGRLKALHDEEEAFKEEFNRMQSVGFVKQGFDRFAFMTTFGITMLEGLETIIIVITFGHSLHKMNFTVLGRCTCSDSRYFSWLYFAKTTIQGA
ncbi:hypothetical protein [Paenibacillus sp. WC2504]|uniref:hypothetical protein n=1 Tax=Paenibacillus sp. WC2504 TaxID=3461403 RepID=UPI00404562DC